MHVLCCFCWVDWRSRCSFYWTLRKLTVYSYSLAADPGRIFRNSFANGQEQVLSDAHIQMIVKEMESVRRFGRGQGEPAITALSEAMGFPATYRAALDLASDKNLSSHTPAKVDPRFSGANFVFWHTGGWHFELGYNGEWSAYEPPMKVGKDSMSEIGFYEFLLDLIQTSSSRLVILPCFQLTRLFALMLKWLPSGTSTWLTKRMRARALPLTLAHCPARSTRAAKSLQACWLKYRKIN